MLNSTLLQAIDTQGLRCAAAHVSAQRTAFFRTITWLGSLYTLVPIALLFSAYLWSDGHTEAIVLLAKGFGGTIVLVRLVKRWVKRPRPCAFPSLVPLPPDTSFPSAHTAQVVALALCASLIMGGSLLTLALIAVSVIVALSRIYLQVHFPTDVLGGATLAIVVVLCSQ